MKKTSQQGRREFMRRLLGGVLLLPGGAGLSLLGMPGRTLAAPGDAGDYRALVCLYLHGGNDSFNMLVPTAPAAHARYRRTRGNLNVINLRPNSLFCRKISSIHHHLKESEMNSVPAVPTTDQAVLPKII